MSSVFSLMPARMVAISIALACALGLLAAYAFAKTDVQPEGEVFGGYSWLHPNGYADLGFNLQTVQNCVSIEDWGECTFEKNPKDPSRLDNDCRDTLDKLALRVLQTPNGKLDIVGYTDQKEVGNKQTLGSQRAVNVKHYLTTTGPTKVYGDRIQPRQGGTNGQATHFYFVPEGSLCSGQVEEGSVVDETHVRAQ